MALTRFILASFSWRTWNSAWLTLAIPFIGEEILGFRVNSTKGSIFYMFSPLFTMELCLDRPFLRAPWKFWLNMGAMHGLAWLSLLLACRHTKHSWRDQPQAGWLQKWTAHFSRWRKVNSGPKSIGGRSLLDQNPMAWLEGRDRSQERILWILLGVSALLIFAIGQLSPPRWPDDGFVILWSLLAHYVLCIWIALQAPRRLADDKQSGALELLLSTPMTPAEIIRGLMQVCRRRFGGPLLALLTIDFLLVNAFFNAHTLTRNSYSEMYQLATCALIVFPLQAWSLARLGIYQGLVGGNSLRATFIVLWLIVLLPWLLFFGCIFVCEVGRRSFRFLPRITDEIAFNLWIAAHLAPFAVLLLFSNNRLHSRFRALAAQSASRRWWKRH